MFTVKYAGETISGQRWRDLNMLTDARLVYMLDVMNFSC